MAAHNPDSNQFTIFTFILSTSHHSTVYVTRDHATNSGVYTGAIYSNDAGSAAATAGRAPLAVGSHRPNGNPHPWSLLTP